MTHVLTLQPPAVRLRHHYHKKRSRPLSTNASQTPIFKPGEGFEEEQLRRADQLLCTQPPPPFSLRQPARAPGFQPPNIMLRRPVLMETAKY